MEEKINLMRRRLKPSFMDELDNEIMEGEACPHTVKYIVLDERQRYTD